VVTVALGTLLAGSAAFALARTDGTADPAVEPSTTTTAAAPSDDVADADADADDTGGPLAVDTVTAPLWDASRDRPIALTLRLPVTDDPVPLVVIVHGYAAAAADYDALADELAAAGFAVASPDFPLSSSAVTSAPSRDITAQAADVSFVVDTLLDPGGPVPGASARIDGARVAVVGHSDGGVTAAGVAFNDGAADPRIGAAVVLSGGAFGFPGAWFSDDTPAALLVVHGTADAVNPFASSQSLYDEAAGTKWFVAVEGGSHVGPFTTDESVADVAALTADFLHATLGGDSAAAARLAAGADAGSLALVAAA
jgi:alpha-beta hydrolase superfamily lysophospholipase